MENSLPIQVRWSDIDANRHLRHSVYYDYGAYCRMVFLSANGLDISKMEELQTGPVIFREEAIFKREVMFEDTIVMTCEMIKATPDYSRWSIRHKLIKNDGIVAAILTVDGAWIDLEKRKLAHPHIFIQEAFDKLPRSPDFEIYVLEKKVV